MANWLLILIGLWTYPLIGLVLMRLANNRTTLKKRLLLVSLLVSALSLFCLAVNISTTCSILDWIIATSTYFTISLLLWWTQFQYNKLLKYAGIVAMVVVFGIGYFSSTVGALGVGFVVAEYDTDTEQWLGEGLIYKESTLGNAISDYRGKRVEIFRTISWLPIIEWRIQKKDYFTLGLYANKVNATYKPQENQIYLSISKSSEQDSLAISWSDSLLLDQ